MISENSFIEIEVVASSLFDFIDDFVDDTDKVLALKEYLKIDDSIEDFKQDIYLASQFQIARIYKALDLECEIYSQNEHVYFLYALFRQYCHDNLLSYHDYYDFCEYNKESTKARQIWALSLKEFNVSELFEYIQYPFYYANVENASDYMLYLFGIAVDIMQRMGETPRRKAITQGIFNIYKNDKGKTMGQFYKSADSIITEEEYKTIYDVTIPLLDFYKDLCQNQQFIDAFKEIPGISQSIDASTDISELVFIVYTNLICGCYKHLNHYPIDIHSKEGALMVLWLQFRSADKERTYDYYNHLMRDEGYTDTLQGTVESMANAVDVQSPNNDYYNLISAVLSNVDVNLQIKYLVLLYRAASVIAKIDGHVSAEESSWLARLLEKTEKLSEEVSPSSNAIDDNADYINQLQELIGLDSVKSDVLSLSNFIKMKQMRESKGLKTPQISLHCVFTGNPGTGKTTVARILAGIFKNLGVLQKGHLVETDRSGLVAEYVGQTAVKTNKIIDSALDGVLFIDEAYSLVQGGPNDYGKEAISTLLKRMEDDRDRLIVILAGYNNEMQDFINSNPGLRSRFNRYIHFPDYSAIELHKIFNLNLQKNEYTMSPEVSSYLLSRLQDVVENRKKDFGNARYIRNLFEKTIENQANRLSNDTEISIEKLKAIKLDDIKEEI